MPVRRRRRRQWRQCAECTRARTSIFVRKILTTLCGATCCVGARRRPSGDIVADQYYRKNIFVRAFIHAHGRDKCTLAARSNRNAFGQQYCSCTHFTEMQLAQLSFMCVISDADDGRWAMRVVLKVCVYRCPCPCVRGFEDSIS